MEKATYEKLMANWDGLKRKSKNCKSNIYENARVLKEKLDQGQSYMHTTDSSLYLLLPKHNFYDLLYVLTNEDNIEEEIKNLASLWEKDENIRLSIVGKDGEAKAAAELFNKAGFDYGKKYYRTSLGSTTAAAAKNVANPGKARRSSMAIEKAMRLFAEENRPYMSFANAEDAGEILEIFKENFDVLTDNVPELEDIKRYIDAEGVAVLRQDGKIAAFFCWEIRFGIGYVVCQVTRKEYRGALGYAASLMVFQQEHLEKNNIRCKRWVTWRDADNAKLVNFAKANYENNDGVCIYNMVLRK